MVCEEGTARYPFPNCWSGRWNGSSKVFRSNKTKKITCKWICGGWAADGISQIERCCESGGLPNLRKKFQVPRVDNALNKNRERFMCSSTVIARNLRRGQACRDYTKYHYRPLARGNRTTARPCTILGSLFVDSCGAYTNRVLIIFTWEYTH